MLPPDAFKPRSPARSTQYGNYHDNYYDDYYGGSYSGSNYEVIIILMCRYNTCVATIHITPVLKQLHWLPVCYRIIFKILLLSNKALNGTAPYYISELLKYNTPQRKLRSSSQHLLAIPKATLKTYGEKVFAVAAPRLWNSIPLELRSNGSTDIFKRHLKTSF